MSSEYDLIDELELYDLIDKLEIDNDRLRKENEKLQVDVQRLSKLAFDGAAASDRMKLDLILSGCLTAPSQK